MSKSVNLQVTSASYTYKGKKYIKNAIFSVEPKEAKRILGQSLAVKVAESKKVIDKIDLDEEKAGDDTLGKSTLPKLGGTPGGDTGEGKGDQDDELNPEEITEEQLNAMSDKELKALAKKIKVKGLNFLKKREALIKNIKKTLAG